MTRADVLARLELLPLLDVSWADFMACGEVMAALKRPGRRVVLVGAAARRARRSLGLLGIPYEGVDWQPTPPGMVRLSGFIAYTGRPPTQEEINRVESVTTVRWTE